MTWEDSGPKSQGKIVTAMLHGNPLDAVRMLRGWSRADREALRRACLEIARQCRAMNAEADRS